MKALFFLLIIFLGSCNFTESSKQIIQVTGNTTNAIDYLTVKDDTIWVKNGKISGIIHRTESQYNYLKLDTWKWPKIVYLTPGSELNLNFGEDWINVANNPINEFLLNKDSILSPYTAHWNMSDSLFRQIWKEEFPLNMSKIDQFFASIDMDPKLISELKQMEWMQRGHRTANFISFQEDKGNKIDRTIYHFVDAIDFHNPRLGFHENNRNFQYYYFLDKVDKTLPNSIYPFAALDTINKYVTIQDIKEMMIYNVVESGLYDESVNHHLLFNNYEKYISVGSKNEKIRKLYQQIQQLKPGKPAPEFGRLFNNKGEEQSISDFKGENILLSVWGTWCPYCKEELPYLKNLLAKYPDQFKNLAIALDKNSVTWQQYLAANEWDAFHLIDPENNSIFRKNYLIRSPNVYFLIDKNGIILASGLKPSSPELETLIEQLE